MHTHNGSRDTRAESISSDCISFYTQLRGRCRVEEGRSEQRIPWKRNGLDDSSSLLLFTRARNTYVLETGWIIFTSRYASTIERSMIKVKFGRSLSFPLKFFSFQFAGGKSDRFRLRATTRETAIRVLGKKKEFGRTRDGFETICRFYGISENRGSIEWRAFFFFGRHVEFAARDAVAKSKAKKRYRSWFNLCVNSWVFSTQFVLLYDDFLYLLRKYNNNNNTTRFEIDDLKNSFKEKWSLILSVNLSDRRFLFSNFSQSCTCIDDPTGFKRIFPRRNWNFNLRKKWKPRLSG